MQEIIKHARVPISCTRCRVTPTGYAHRLRLLQELHDLGVVPERREQLPSVDLLHFDGGHYPLYEHVNGTPLQEGFVHVYGLQGGRGVLLGAWLCY